MQPQLQLLQFSCLEVGRGLTGLLSVSPLPPPPIDLDDHGSWHFWSRGGVVNKDWAGGGRGRSDRKELTCLVLLEAGLYLASFGNWLFLPWFGFFWELLSSLRYFPLQFLVEGKYVSLLAHGLHLILQHLGIRQFTCILFLLRSLHSMDSTPCQFSLLQQTQRKLLPPTYEQSATHPLALSTSQVKVRGQSSVSLSCREYMSISLSDSVEDPSIGPGAAGPP